MRGFTCKGGCFLLDVQFGDGSTDRGGATRAPGSDVRIGKTIWHEVLVGIVVGHTPTSCIALSPVRLVVYVFMLGRRVGQSGLVSQQLEDQGLTETVRRSVKTFI